MKKLVLKKMASYFWKMLFGYKVSEWLINKLAQLSSTNLLDLAHKNLGLLKSNDLDISGENNLIRQVLPSLIRDPIPIIFDVGAHQGEYCEELRKVFPKAQIFALEPNPATFSLLEAKLMNLQINCLNLGLSEDPGSKLLYTYPHNPSASHASLYNAAITEIHRSQNVASFECQFETLDALCHKKNIELIHFLKIDVEGAELQVLKGAARLLSERQILSLQFEFNEMNVISRTFLKDFYELLPNFSFHRIDSNRLLPIGQYHPQNEIFRFQNIFCIQI